MGGGVITKLDYFWGDSIHFMAFFTFRVQNLKIFGYA